MRQTEESLEDIIQIRTLRLNATITGLVLGITAGLIVFIATNWLVIKGGPIGPGGEPVVGPHLSLLNQFFIGYEVTFLGSLIGFGYAFVCGFVGGYFVGYVYNRIVSLSKRKWRRQE